MSRAALELRNFHDCKWLGVAWTAKVSSRLLTFLMTSQCSALMQFGENRIQSVDKVKLHSYWIYFENIDR